MSFELSGRDKDGNPTCVCTDDGFIRTSRKFDQDRDGWMLDQLDYADFPEIETGRRVAALVTEVNDLRRENYRLNRQIEMMYKPSLFGG